jgi:hypothetical protein
MRVPVGGGYTCGFLAGNTGGEQRGRHQRTRVCDVPPLEIQHIPPTRRDLCKCRRHEDRIVRMFRCPSVKTEPECAAAGGVWDRPCADDSECPFFIINRDDKSEGACVSGHCRMPLGVARMSFRKYRLDADSFPLCVGCARDTPPDASCCKRIAFPAVKDTSI